MNARDPHAEEGVREPGRARRVREVDVDDEGREDAEEEVEAELLEPDEGVRGPEDAVAVAVEEVAVLLEDRFVRVLLGPVFVGCPVGVFSVWGNVGARGAWGSELVVSWLDGRERYVPGFRSLRSDSSGLYGFRISVMICVGIDETIGCLLSLFFAKVLG